MRGAQGKRRDLAQVRRRPVVVFAFMSAPIDTPPALGSLGYNQLCGVDSLGNGTYTAEGITKLCEALKGSAVTSLKCAATLERLLLCQCPLTLLTTCSQSGKQQPRSQGSSRSRRGPQGQLDAAIAGVGRLALEPEHPRGCLSVSAR